VTLKGQGRDPNIFGVQYLRLGDNGAPEMEWITGNQTVT